MPHDAGDGSPATDAHASRTAKPILCVSSGKSLAYPGAIVSPTRKHRKAHGLVVIRGTSTYIEIEEKFSRTYVCNCYGQTNIYDKNNNLKKEIKSKYHSPAIITGNGNVGDSPYNVPLNHYDDHIEELNDLVGRSPNWKLPEGKKIFFSPNNLKI